MSNTANILSSWTQEEHTHKYSHSLTLVRAPKLEGRAEGEECRVKGAKEVLKRQSSVREETTPQQGPGRAGELSADQCG